MCRRKGLAHLMNYVVIVFESSEGRYGFWRQRCIEARRGAATRRPGRIVSSSLSFTLTSPPDLIIIWAGYGQILLRMR